MPRRCVFCGSRGPLTREHIVSNWIHRLVSGQSAGIISQDLGEAGQRTIPFSGNFTTFTLRGLCRDCHHGWLTPLETRIAKLVTPMIQGENATLSRADQEAISVWAFKTAIVLDRTQPQEDIVPAHHYRWLQSKRRPGPNSLVMLSVFHVFNSEVLFGLSKFSADRKGPLDRTRDVEGYCVSLVIGHFVLIALGFPFGREIGVRIDPRVMPRLVPIWPTPGTANWPPPLAVTEPMLDQITNGFASNWTTLL
jgi:hypothetical protein